MLPCIELVYCVVINNLETFVYVQISVEKFRGFAMQHDAVGR